MNEQQQVKSQQQGKGGGKGESFVTAITSQGEDYSRWYLDVVLRAELADYTPGLKGWFRRGEFVAVKGADWQLSAGQTLGVIGESGSGKSTLALAALGLQPCSGLLQVQGRSWHYSAQADKPLRRVVQVVFQDPFSSLSPRMTVGELVGEGLRVHHPDLGEAGRRQRVLDTLVSWARQGEVFEYDYNTGTVRLPHAQAPGAGTGSPPHA